MNLYLTVRIDLLFLPATFKITFRRGSKGRCVVVGSFWFQDKYRQKFNQTLWYRAKETGHFAPDIVNIQFKEHY